MTTTATRWNRGAWWTGSALCLALILGAVTKRLPISWPEAIGFATGLWCVALVARNNVWNFPIGLVNNVFLGVVFFEARLFNDLTLQGVFFGLGVWGWRAWVYGGNNKTALPISRATARLLGFTLAGIVLATPVLMLLSQRLGGAQPFLDALTTAISLGAQYLLNSKKLENWWLWILADVIYIPLYLSRHLFLTAALFVCFLALCVLGMQAWRRELVSTQG